MWPDRVSNPGPQTNESGTLPIALRGPVSPDKPDGKRHKHGILYLCHSVQKLKS